MPSSYTVRARFVLQAPGEGTNTWGAILNSGVFQLVDDAILGAVAITVSGPVTLTSANGATDQSRMAILQCSGTGGTITTPGVQNRFLIDARSATGPVVVTTGSGLNATVEAGNVLEAYCPDGTNWYLSRDLWLQSNLNGSITSGNASTLASAKAYTDNKVVASSGALPGSSTPRAVVYTDPTSGAAVWHVITSADIADFAAAVNMPLAAVQALVDADTIQLAYLALTTSVSTMTPNGRGYQDDYADQSGIDLPNSTIVYAAGDVTNLTNTQNEATPSMPKPSDVAGTSGAAASPGAGIPGFSFAAQNPGFNSAYFPADILQQRNTGNGWGDNGSQGVNGLLTLTFDKAITVYAWRHAPSAVNAFYGSGNTPILSYSNDGTNFTEADRYTTSTTPNSTLTTRNLATAVTAKYWRLSPNAGSSAFGVTQFDLLQRSVTPGAAVLRAQPANLSFTPSRGYVFHLAKLGSGAVLNTDLIGSAGRTGAAFGAGTYKTLAGPFPSGFSLIGLYDAADGKLGVNLTGQAAGQAIYGRDAMTATARIDIAASFYGGA